MWIDSPMSRYKSVGSFASRMNLLQTANGKTDQNIAIQAIFEEEGKNKMKLRKLKAKKNKATIDRLFRAGNLYNENPSSKQLVQAVRNTKIIKRQYVYNNQELIGKRPNSAMAPRSKLEFNLADSRPGWRAGQWHQRATYDDILIIEDREREQSRTCDISKTSGKSKYDAPLIVTESGYCPKCEKWGRTKAPVKKLHNWKPRRTVAGKMHKEPEYEHKYHKDATLTISRPATADVLWERNQASVREQERRKNLRSQVEKQLLVHHAIKEISIKQLRKILYGEDINKLKYVSPSSETGKQECQPKYINRLQFMRTMRFFGFEYSDARLLSRIYSTFDFKILDSVEVEEFINFFSHIKEKSLKKRFRWLN